MPLDATHDPNLRSWVESANDPATDYPMQGLPVCLYDAEHDGHTHPHLAVRIGDRVLDVSQLWEAGYFEADEPLDEALRLPGMLGLVETPGVLGRLRVRLQEFLRHDAPAGQQIRRLRSKTLLAADEVPIQTRLPMMNYTDFYASIHHASLVGSMLRPDAPLMPNYKWIPIGYHGRGSSVVASGLPVARPHGQLGPPEDNPAGPPVFGPSRMLDYELEVGVVIQGANPLGQPVPISQARGRIAGIILVNDWSARDIQRWEYQPLGPFLGKSFATTIGSVLVPIEALEPFRCPAYARPAGDPQPIEYLRDEDDQRAGGLDLWLEVLIQTSAMRDKGLPPARLSLSRSFREMYWTFAQMIAHHASNGCNLVAGDLLASGTVSGPGPAERGCLLELTWAGRGPDGKPAPRKPIELPGGETRIFLQDGDEIIMRGWCEREGYRRLGLGECRARIGPQIGP